MALRVYTSVEDRDKCDKCHKVASVIRPVIMLETTSRYADGRSFIQLHVDCLKREIDKAVQS